MSFQAMAWAVKQKTSNSGQKLVLLMLSNYCNSHTGQCNPSHKTLADECSMGVSTLKGHLSALQDAGLIEIIHKSVDSVALPNQYMLKLDGVGQNLADGGSESDRWVGQNLATNLEVEPINEPYISTDVDIVASKLPTSNNCPHQEILKLFAKRLPEMPQPRIWKAKRAKDLADRWKWVLSAKREDGTPYATDKESALEFFDRFFAYVAESDFLTGRNGAWTGCDLPWLVKEDKFANIISGKYENRG